MYFPATTCNWHDAGPPRPRTPSRSRSPQRRGGGDRGYYNKDEKDLNRREEIRASRNVSSRQQHTRKSFISTFIYFVCFWFILSNTKIHAVKHTWSYMFKKLIIHAYTMPLHDLNKLAQVTPPRNTKNNYNNKNKNKINYLK